MKCGLRSRQAFLAAEHFEPQGSFPGPFRAEYGDAALERVSESKDFHAVLGMQAHPDLLQRFRPLFQQERGQVDQSFLACSGTGLRP